MIWLPSFHYHRHKQLCSCPVNSWRMDRMLLSSCCTRSAHHPFVAAEARQWPAGYVTMRMCSYCGSQSDCYQADNHLCVSLSLIIPAAAFRSQRAMQGLPGCSAEAVLLDIGYKHHHTTVTQQLVLLTELCLNQCYQIRCSGLHAWFTHARAPELLLGVLLIHSWSCAQCCEWWGVACRL